jgi:hypothetical protein
MGFAGNRSGRLATTGREAEKPATGNAGLLLIKLFQFPDLAKFLSETTFGRILSGSVIRLPGCNAKGLGSLTGIIIFF